MKENVSNSKSKMFLSRPGNIVLVGLPGSGKTTIGQNLAWQIGRGFFDCDQAIEILKKKS